MGWMEGSFEILSAQEIAILLYWKVPFWLFFADFGSTEMYSDIGK